MEDNDAKRKKIKSIPSPLEIKTLILNAKEPIVLKGILSWDSLRWSFDDWVKNLENPDLHFRLGTKKCAKEPQWESNCEIVLSSLSDLIATQEDTWMYFDYKHMKQHFKDKTDLLESLSWADFGFPNKNGKDSTVWMASPGAYTPCHMDSYGCNIVAQVLGRKLWVMFPPEKSSSLRPTRVPYEESSIYSSIHFGCGLNDFTGLDDARVVELTPGDVLVVPRHWWHYVENLTTAISVNMWIPLESDRQSRLEESLVRYFVALSVKNMEIQGETTLLNPNEMDLLDDPVDIRQISWCMDQVLRAGSCDQALAEGSERDNSTCVSAVDTVTSQQLKQLLLNKCGCTDNNTSPQDKTPSRTLAVDNVINAFCHPDVIAKVAEILLLSKK